eukprot:1652466-Amphidinium_carterae.1
MREMRASSTMMKTPGYRTHIAPNQRSSKGENEVARHTVCASFDASLLKFHTRSSDFQSGGFAKVFCLRPSMVCNTMVQSADADITTTTPRPIIS